MATDMSRGSLETPDWLCCHICYDNFNRPRVLPCLHSFCQDCLQKHIDVHTNANRLRQGTNKVHSFPCPTCRECIIFPVDGATAFRHDFRVQQLLDLRLQMLDARSTARDRDLSDASCYFCLFITEDDRDAEYICINCQKSLCKECSESHPQRALFADHEIRAKSAGNQNPASVSETSCKSHGGAAIDFFCLSCNDGICLICTMTSHDHHKITDMKAGLQGYHSNAISLCSMLQTRVTELHSVLEHSTQAEDTLRKSQKEVKKKIRDQAENFVGSIREQEGKLIEQLTERCKLRLLELRTTRSEVEVTAASMESLRDFVSDILSRNKVTFQLVPVYQEVISRMEAILKESRIHKAANLGMTFNFVPSTKVVKLGKLQSETTELLPRSQSLFSVPNSSPEVKSLFPGSSAVRPRSHEVPPTGPAVLGSQKSFPESVKGLLYGDLKIPQLVCIGKQGAARDEFHTPKDVCRLPGELIVIADTGNRRLQILDKYGRHHKVLCEGQLQPCGVAATSGGHILVADALGKCATLVDAEGKIVKKIAKFLCPCGVAVTQDRNFLITDFFSPSVYVVSPAGSLLRQFDFRGRKDRYSSGASYLAVAKQGHIIVSDASNKCVKIFDKYGKYLSKISSQVETKGTNELGSRKRNSFLETEKFNPAGVAMDTYDNVCIADSLCGLIYVFRQTGELITIISNNSQSHKGLSGITVLPGRVVIATDVSNHQVVFYQPKSDLHRIIMKLPKDVVGTECSAPNPERSELPA